jgi:hypothetical protein
MRANRQPGLALGEVITTLKKEGWRVGRHHVAHAIASGAVPEPPKRGGWRRFTAQHVELLRSYLAERSRSQPREAGR